jgi:hypothetical protein
MVVTPVMVLIYGALRHWLWVIAAGHETKLIPNSVSPEKERNYAR